MPTVLVVDTEQPIREVICAGLKTIDVEGVPALPHEAISIFADGDFDLVVTGRSMPTPEKGEALVLHLKAIDPVPVLMLSSDITVPPAGVDVLLPKPFSMEVFLKTVKNLLRKSEGVQQRPTMFSHYGYPVRDEPIPQQPPPSERCSYCNSKHAITECCQA